MTNPAKRNGVRYFGDANFGIGKSCFDRVITTLATQMPMIEAKAPAAAMEVAEGPLEDAVNRTMGIVSHSDQALG
jgi:hypothetical protein